MTEKQKVTFQVRVLSEGDFVVTVDGIPCGPDVEVWDAKAVVLWLREAWPSLVALLPKEETQ